jgi:hypothetical protein
MTLARVFIGGTINNGTGPDWQADASKALSDLPIYIFNPRRVDWDPNASDEVKTKQIEWEFEAQVNSDFILYNFEPEFPNPVTLLELGLFSSSNKTVVRCSSTFPQYLNVKFVCEKLGVPIVETLEEALTKMRERIETHRKNVLMAQNAQKVQSSDLPQVAESSSATEDKEDQEDPVLNPHSQAKQDIGALIEMLNKILSTEEDQCEDPECKVCCDEKECTVEETDRTDRTDKTERTERTDRTEIEEID